MPFQVSVGVYGRNFEQALLRDFIPKNLQDAGVGVSHYKIKLPLADFRWWHPDHPWLYEAQVMLINEAGKPSDRRQTVFGMRTFEISEEGVEKGRLFLNGEEIRLRGANTMGHEQQAVYRGDLDQLRKDILIAKYAGLNFLRITQRPVQSEVYEECDRLGMMVQTDLPLFGKMRRTQFAEGIRQAGAMERLIRGHASCVLVSLINEPFPISWGDTTHRHLTRPELEAFLRACGEIIRFENPDRQIKPVDGDYDPPAPGLPDNHSYCGWYVGHGLDLGKLHRGYWVPVKPGWRYACGEFGAEGLDPVDLMWRRYPKGWLPGNADDKGWTPSQISHAQTGKMYGLWMDLEETMDGWVGASQEHQAWSVRVMTRAFRRDRRMVSFALHLLIDAFPAGWMKSVVDCERNPKPAYFAYREALQPLLVDARLDRWAWWGGEVFTAEAWVCNDRCSALDSMVLRYIFSVDGLPIASGAVPSVAHQQDSTFQGMLRIPLPEVDRRAHGHLRLALTDGNGTVLNDTEEAVTLFPKPGKWQPERPICLLNLGAGSAYRLASELGIPYRIKTSPEAGDIILADQPDSLDSLIPAVCKGATLILLELPEGVFQIGEHEIRVEAAGYGPRQFVSRATGNPLVEGFEKNDFKFWYDASEDSVTALLDNLFFAKEWTPVLTTPQVGWAQESGPALACGECRLGGGAGYRLSA